MISLNLSDRRTFGFVAVVLAGISGFMAEIFVGRELTLAAGSTFETWSGASAAFQTVLLLAYLFSVLLVRLPTLWAAVAVAVLGAFSQASFWSEKSEPLGASAWAIGLWVLRHYGPSLSVLFLVFPAVHHAFGARSAHLSRGLYRASNWAAFVGLLLAVLVLDLLTPLHVVRALVSCLSALSTLALVVLFARFADHACVSRSALAEGLVPRLLVPFATSGLCTAATTFLSAELGGSSLSFVFPLAAFLIGLTRGASSSQPLSRANQVRLALASLVFLSLANAGTLFLSSWMCVVFASLAVVLAVWNASAQWFRSSEVADQNSPLQFALGGAMGAIFAAQFCARLGNNVFEFFWFGLLAIALVVGGWPRAPWRRVPVCLLVLSFPVFAGLIPFPKSRHLVSQGRTPYGPFRVVDRADLRYFIQGTTRHGVEDRRHRGQAVGYHRVDGPFGTAFEELRASHNRPLRVAILSLGVGALAAYAREGDTFVFVEIDRAVEGVARRYFSYLETCGTACSVNIADARRWLGVQSPGSYDAIFFDAFASDSVPVHLLTIECMNLAARALRSDGVLYEHVSNRGLHLGRVLSANAGSLGWSIRRVRGELSRQSLGDDRVDLFGIRPRAELVVSSVAQPFSDEIASPLRLWLVAH